MSTLGSRQPQICSYYGAIKVVLFLVVEQYQTQSVSQSVFTTTM